MNSACLSKLSLLLTLPLLMDDLSATLLGFFNRVMDSGLITNGQDLFPSLRGYLIFGSKPCAPAYWTLLTIPSLAGSSAISGLVTGPPPPFKSAGIGFGAMIQTDSTIDFPLDGRHGFPM